MPLDHAPDFALSFTTDAVQLLRRKNDLEWQELGQAEFSSPSFRADLADLRSLASHDRASPLPVVLLIPQDQILYTSLNVPTGPGREVEVARALDGLTPYAIEELAFDWKDEGEDVRVAAVARQTLVEAQEFALRHGFFGSGYSAQPTGGDYPGVPIFDVDAPPVITDEPAVVPEFDDLNLDLDADLPEMVEEEDFRDPPTEAEIADADFVELDEGFQPTVPADQPELAGLDLPPVEIEDAEIVDILPEPVAEAEPVNVDQAELKLDAEPVEDVEAEEDQAEQVADDTTSVVEGAHDTPTVDELSVTADEAEEPAEEEVSAATDDAQPEADVTEAEADVATASEEATTTEALDEPASEDEDDLTDAEREALATAAAEVAGAEAAAAAQAATVVRHGAPSAYVGKRLNPRAKAVHDRAAEARSQAAPSPVAPTRKPRRSGGRIGELAAMIGALIVGLALVWTFFVPGDRASDVPRQIANTPAVEAVSPSENTDEVEQATASDQSLPDAQVQEPITAETSAEPEVGSTAIAEAPVAVTPAAPEVEVPAPAQTATTALSPLERAMVNAAATGPSEAIVAATAAAMSRPAQTIAAAPTSNDTVGATTQQASIRAQTAPTTSRPAPTRPATPTPAPTASAPAATPAPRANAQATPAATPQPERRAGLTHSARPKSAPRRQASAPRQDTPPTVPSNPLPFEVTQQPSVRPAAVRPPRRDARPAPSQPAATPVATEQPAPQATAATKLRSSSRPPSRPEGSTPDFETELTPAEHQHIDQILRDLRRAELGTSELSPTERRAVFQVADARPMRKPGSARAQSPSTSGVSQGAVDDAVRSAGATAPPPAERPTSAQAATSPARDSGGLLNSSGRPRAKPASARSAAQAATGTNSESVTNALNEAVAAAAPLGGVTLNALTSSHLPPRRSGGAAAAAATTEVAAAAPTTAAAPAAPDDAVAAERRRLDEQLQSQAEARIRARAAADAAAEAQARAQAEARARAQVAAEEQQAQRRRQTYRPQELDDEPDAALAVRGGNTAANVAAAATQRRGIDLGRTTIIGIIGAGQASRALIRLRNGKIVTVRLGDRIDGGTINSIGDGRLTYVKAGRTHELRLLDGR